MNCIIRIFSLLVLVFIGCTEKKVEKEENPTKILIENKIGFSFPDFIEINSDNSAVAFNGDYTKVVKLKFKPDVDLNEFYGKIKEQLQYPQSMDYIKKNDCIVLIDEWHVDTKGEYSYSFMSECDNGDDVHFSLVINSKDSTVTLSYGYW